MKAGERVPVNRVRALALQHELTNEFGKPEWREAEKRAWLRWTAKGGKPVKLAPSGPIARRRGGYYA